ncbi:hypothetical protein MAMT_01598 [Methylacidimicrobium tartarophylax]|uniref:Uncharacterized protein n=1 Tax=Methylacidimicrobium tartarophylax TaxID=1041768 RepID=A0A5E6MNX1_9BACT|nr:hypothetical protein MAMT_01598 [Methylacidimicrobium tartarophylax]
MTSLPVSQALSCCLHPRLGYEHCKTDELEFGKKRLTDFLPSWFDTET